MRPARSAIATTMRDPSAALATMPWTAPVFDNRTVTSDPQLICMSSMDGRDVAGDYREPGSTCLTEQGTRVEISRPECRKVARFGPQYNPYRQQRPEPSRREFGGVGGSPPTAMASVDAAPSPGATITAPQVTGYGDIAARRIEAAPVDRW